jgi:hypothetical protein
MVVTVRLNLNDYISAHHVCAPSTYLGRWTPSPQIGTLPGQISLSEQGLFAELADWADTFKLGQSDSASAMEPGTSTNRSGASAFAKALEKAASEWLDGNNLTWLLTPPKIKLLPVTDAHKPWPLSWEELARPV